MCCEPFCDAVLQSKVIGRNVPHIPERHYEKRVDHFGLGTSLRTKLMAGITTVAFSRECGGYRIMTDCRHFCANSKVSFNSMSGMLI